MSQSPAPVDKDTVAMIINTIDSWREQRRHHAQKLAEFNELFRRLGVDPEIESGQPAASADASPQPRQMSPIQQAQMRVQPGISDEFKPRRIQQPNQGKEDSELNADEFEQYIAQTKARLTTSGSLSDPDQSSVG